MQVDDAPVDDNKAVVKAVEVNTKRRSHYKRCQSFLIEQTTLSIIQFA